MSLDMDNIILLPGRMTKNREDRFITITDHQLHLF